MKTYPAHKGYPDIHRGRDLANTAPNRPNQKPITFLDLMTPPPAPAYKTRKISTREMLLVALFIIEIVLSRV